MTGGASKSSKSNVRLAQASIAHFFQRSESKSNKTLEGSAGTPQPASEQPAASQDTHEHDAKREVKRQRLDVEHKVAAVAVQEAPVRSPVKAEAPSGWGRQADGGDPFNGFAFNGGPKDALHAHVKRPLDSLHAQLHMQVKARTADASAMNKQHVNDAVQAGNSGRAKRGTHAAGVSRTKNTKGKRRGKNAANEGDASPAKGVAAVDTDTANGLVGNLKKGSGDPASADAAVDRAECVYGSGKSNHSSQVDLTSVAAGCKIAKQNIVLKEGQLLDAGMVAGEDNEGGVHGALECSDIAVEVQQMSKSEGVLSGCSSPVRGVAVGVDMEASHMEEDCPEDEGMNYEKQRDERIRKNMEMLASMGLLNMIPPAAVPAPKAAKKSKSSKPKQAAAEQAQPVPRRSGLRSQIKTDVVTDVGTMDAAGKAGLDDPQLSEVEVHYQQSALHNYVCSTCPEFTWSAGDILSHGQGEGREMIAVNEVPGCFSDASLTRIYSMDVRGDLLAAAGKDGRVAVFGIQGIQGITDDSDAVPPLLSCKLHSGWISDIQFLDCAHQSNKGQTFDQGQTPTSPPGMGERSEQLLMVSAGNDNLLALWDLSQTAVAPAGSCKGGNGGVPKLVCSSKTVHSGGIFSMHQRGDAILTASKDSSVAVTRVVPDGSFSIIHQYAALFNSVVKCCRWRDPNVFAAGGNDRMLAIVDTRMPLESPTTGTSPDAHTAPINSLSWSPSDPHLLLTASNDPCIKLWDARNLSNPVYTYQGHAMSTNIKSIYNPLFVGRGSLIATGGEKSSSLTLYCVKTGRTISRGDIGYTPDNLQAFSAGSMLLAARARRINLLTAVWR